VCLELRERNRLIGGHEARIAIPPHTSKSVQGGYSISKIQAPFRMTLAKQILGEVLHRQDGHHLVPGHHWLGHKRHDTSPVGCQSRNPLGLARSLECDFLCHRA
jgi:hypothetical protein